MDNKRYLDTLVQFVSGIELQICEKNEATNFAGDEIVENLIHNCFKFIEIDIQHF